MPKALVSVAVALTALAANAEPPEEPARAFTGRDLFGHAVVDLLAAIESELRRHGV